LSKKILQFDFNFNTIYPFFTENMCGKIVGPDTTFVINRSPRVHWPWMASYGFINDEKKWQHQCGATLISDQHFLTAAHCVKLGVKEG
jgi:hypothetical protein